MARNAGFLCGTLNLQCLNLFFMDQAPTLQYSLIFQVITALMAAHPVVSEIKLKEVLGHSPRQVRTQLTFLEATLGNSMIGTMKASRRYL